MVSARKVISKQENKYSNEIITITIYRRVGLLIGSLVNFKLVEILIDLLGT